MTNSDYRSTIGSFSKKTTAALAIALVAATALSGCTTTQGSFKGNSTPMTLAPSQDSPPVRVVV